MSKVNAFKDLQAIKKAIRHLYSSLGAERLRTFTDDFVAETTNPRYCCDPIIATQRLSSDIVSHYRLPVASVIAAYSATLPVPGRVEIGGGDDFFVELHSKYRGQLHVVAAILAHEVAHVFLHKCGIEWSDTAANEILTDTTACFLGFGATILNAQRPCTEHLASETRTRWPHFGYLTAEEFGYVIARRNRAFKLSARASIEPQHCKAAYEAGLKECLRETSARPFTPRPWHERLLARVLAPKEPAAIRFECPTCRQTLRVPALHKEIAVHCPVCDSRFPVYA